MVNRLRRNLMIGVPAALMLRPFAAVAQALADVRSAAAEAAVSAAEIILRRSATGKVADALVSRGIADLKGKLG